MFPYKKMLCDKITKPMKICKFYLTHLMVAIPLSVLVLVDKFCIQFYVPELLNTLLTFRHRASSVWDRRFPTLQRTPFIYLINKYISFSDICLTVHH